MVILSTLIIGLLIILFFIAIIKNRKENKLIYNRSVISQCSKDISYIEHAIMSSYDAPIPPEVKVILYARIDRLLLRIHQLDPNQVSATNKRALIANTINELNLLTFHYELPTIVNEYTSKENVKAITDILIILNTELKRKNHHPQIQKLINILKFYIIYYKTQTAINKAQTAYKSKFYNIAREQLLITQKILNQNKSITEGKQWVDTKLEMCNRNIPKINKVIKKEIEKDKQHFNQKAAPSNDQGLSRVITNEKVKQ